MSLVEEHYRSHQTIVSGSALDSPTETAEPTGIDVNREYAEVFKVYRVVE